MYSGFALSQNVLRIYCMMEKVGAEFHSLLFSALLMFLLFDYTQHPNLGFLFRDFNRFTYILHKKLEYLCCWIAKFSPKS